MGNFKLVRHSLHQSLVAPLREMILNGELRPGDKVPEEMLCEQFGVSRTPIREAVKVLAAEGVLQIIPHRGAIVARITEDQIKELFPIMAALERLAGILACSNATDKDIKRMRALHDMMFVFFEKKDESQYLRYNRMIHELFFEIADNETLTTYYQQILTRIHACRFVMRKSPEHWAAAAQEHHALMDAFEARDANRLGTLLEAHITGITSGIAHAFLERLDGAEHKKNTATGSMSRAKSTAKN